MSFESDYKPYLDKWNLVQPETNGLTSDNGIRFTAECLMAATREISTELEFILDRVNAINNCQRAGYWGLLVRSPENIESQEGPDDYYAACAVGYLYKRTFAMFIYSYGVKNNFVFNNKTPGQFSWSAWLGRQPALIAHMRHCAGQELSWLDQLAMCIGLYLAARSTDQDGKVLSWFMVRCVKNHYRLIDKAISYWQSKFKQQYPGGVGQVLGKYYSPAHFDHPNSKYLMGVFD